MSAPVVNTVTISQQNMQDFAAIDFEAANGKMTSACSVGVVVVRGGSVVDTFYSLIHPVPNYYHWYCSKVNGLKRRDTDSAPRFPKVWQQVAPLVDGLTFVAHGKNFDEGCLHAVMDYYHMPWPGYTFLCTMQASLRALPDLPNHHLETVAEACGYKLEHHHHALSDAEACAAIALKIL